MYAKIVFALRLSLCVLGKDATSGSNLRFHRSAARGSHCEGRRAGLYRGHEVSHSETDEIGIDNRRVSHGLGWPANAMFFYNRIREKHFFILPVVNDNEIVRSTSDGAERKSGFICLVRYIQSCWCRRVSQFLVTLGNG